MTQAYLLMREYLYEVTHPTPRDPDDERGQGMVEYALILVLIAVVVILVVSTVGKRVSNVFSNVSNGLSQ